MNVFDTILYGWLGGIAARVSQPSRADRERRLWVRPQVAYGISREALVLTDRPRELRALEPRRVSSPTLCLEIGNAGREPIAVDEVGLSGWFDRPRIGMREPLLHDGKPWPRTLAPEETVIAYLTSSIQSHSVLPSIRFGYALSDRSEIWIGASAAILYFLTWTAPTPSAQQDRLREA